MLFRIYFGLSLLISAIWIVKVMFSDAGYARLYSTGYGRAEGSSDKAAQNLGGPSREYALAFTDHVYCLNEQGRQGRRGRMNELFRYMRMDVEMVNTTHLEIWRDMTNKGYDRALVVEDDIDFEIDALPRISRALDRVGSAQWDILYVGHCSMDEDTGRPLGQHIFASVHPFCTSGYVLSHSGAQKLFAYFARNMRQTHSLDVQLVALVKRKLLHAYSVYPPLVFQRRDLYPSDDGMELKVVRLLTNSAWDEARAFVPHLANWSNPKDQKHLDPAFKHIPSWMEDKNIVN
ncbi:hypothetical protein GGF46_003290 [Coemansia sp. RSA 552]|nr:hypothetical protein GGF46_003290 [Coemansia sp. RSA 552]